MGLSTHGLRLTAAALVTPVLGWLPRGGEDSESQPVRTGASGLSSHDAGCCGHQEPERGHVHGPGSSGSGSLETTTT